MTNPEYKDLEELIAKLEHIKNEGSGPISLPKAVLLLCLEIKEIKEKLTKITKDNSLLV